MKLSHVLAALALLPVLAAQAQSGVTLNGYADGAVLLESGGPSGTQRKVASGVAGPTRLVFRGTEDLGGGLSAFFHLEAGVLFDTGGSLQQNFFGRQAYVGIAGSLGSLRGGLTYTPIFITLRDVADPFRASYAGQAGNIVTVAVPAGPKSVGFPNPSAPTGTVASGAVSRANTLQYFSPKFSGFGGEAAYSFGEAPAGGNALRTLGAAFGYEGSALAVRLAASNTRNVTDTERANNWLAAANYDFGIVRVHAGYGGNKGYGAADSRDMLTGISAPIGLGRVLGSYVRKNDRSPAHNNVHQWAAGYVYSLSKRTQLHASYARISNSLPNTSPGFYTVGSPAGPGSGDRMLALGIGHLF